MAAGATISWSTPVAGQAAGHERQGGDLGLDDRTLRLFLAENAKQVFRLDS
jgi:hypothetical protein